MSVFCLFTHDPYGLGSPRWSFGHLLNPPRGVRARTSPLLRLRAVHFKIFYDSENPRRGGLAEARQRAALEGKLHIRERLFNPLDQFADRVFIGSPAQILRR